MVKPKARARKLVEFGRMIILPRDPLFGTIVAEQMILRERWLA
jgi:hypothetical protein